MISKEIAYLGPEGKSQVTVEYKDGKPIRVDAIVVSNQHDDGIAHETIENDITELVIKPICKDFMDENTKEEFKVKGEELLKKIKELLHEGNIRRLVIKNEEGKTYLEIPVNVGVVGLLLAPVLAAVGALAALAANFKIEVIKKDNGDDKKEEEEE